MFTSIHNKVAYSTTPCSAYFIMSECQVRGWKKKREQIMRVKSRWRLGDTAADNNNATVLAVLFNNVVMLFCIINSTKISMNYFRNHRSIRCYPQAQFLQANFQVWYRSCHFWRGSDDVSLSRKLQVPDSLENASYVPSRLGLTWNCTKLFHERVANDLHIPNKCENHNVKDFFAVLPIGKVFSSAANRWYERKCLKVVWWRRYLCNRNRQEV